MSENKDIRQFLDEWLDCLNTVSFSKLPDMDLYMDQLTTLLEKNLEGYKRIKSEKILTKTMINNYTKDAVLPPPEKKKYSVEHAALLIIIYHLKREISMSDIALLFDAVEEVKLGVEKFYRYFEEIQKHELERLEKEIQENLSLADFLEENDEGVRNTLFAVSLIISSSLRKHIAEKIIDSLIPKLS
ncbi:MAG: DUF1836 domain-containing protein [Clostridiales bacterium]|jgi:DNA-binding transcriptional MerR regulator|nr:DUF1836 domain-containing protein [Clostridiales bacterium]